MIEAWYLVSLPVDIDFFLRRESRTIADGSAPVDFPNFFQSQQNCNLFAWNFYFLNESDLKTLHLRKQHQYTKTAAIFQQKFKYHPSSLRNNNNSEPNFFSFAGQQQCCDVQSIIIFSWCFRSDKWRILPLFAKKICRLSKKKFVSNFWHRGLWLLFSTFVNFSISCGFNEGHGKLASSCMMTKLVEIERSSVQMLVGWMYSATTGSSFKQADNKEEGRSGLLYFRPFYTKMSQLWT